MEIRQSAKALVLEVEEAGEPLTEWGFTESGAKKLKNYFSKNLPEYSLSIYSNYEGLFNIDIEKI